MSSPVLPVVVGPVSLGRRTGREERGGKTVEGGEDYAEAAEAEEAAGIDPQNKLNIKNSSLPCAGLMMAARHLLH